MAEMLLEEKKATLHKCYLMMRKIIMERILTDQKIEEDLSYFMMICGWLKGDEGDGGKGSSSKRDDDFVEVELEVGAAGCWQE